MNDVSIVFQIQQLEDLADMLKHKMEILRESNFNHKNEGKCVLSVLEYSIQVTNDTINELNHKK